MANVNNFEQHKDLVLDFSQLFSVFSWTSLSFLVHDNLALFFTALKTPLLGEKK